MARTDDRRLQDRIERNLRFEDRLPGDLRWRQALLNFATRGSRGHPAITVTVVLPSATDFVFLGSDEGGLRAVHIHAIVESARLKDSSARTD